MNQYEAMFVFDPTFGGSFEDCEGAIRRLMERAEAEIMFCRKWDERRLAYKIKGRKRGVYVLVYFKALPGKIPSIERDAQITEEILRLLILRADGITRDVMERAVSPLGEAELSATGGEPEGGRPAGRREAPGERREAPAKERPAASDEGTPVIETGTSDVKPAESEPAAAESPLPEVEEQEG